MAQVAAFDPATVARILDGQQAFALSPDRWLVVAAGEDDESLVDRLRDRLGDVAAVTDQGHGRIIIRIEGAASRDLLAKGCSIDLHPSHARPGDCWQTEIAHVPVLLHQVDAAQFDAYVARSYGQSFWEWLLDAAGEFSL
jgi:sarcosine oxidase subunit gamma